MNSLLNFWKKDSAAVCNQCEEHRKEIEVLKIERDQLKKILYELTLANHAMNLKPAYPKEVWLTPYPFGGHKSPRGSMIQLHHRAYLEKHTDGRPLVRYVKAPKEKE